MGILAKHAQDNYFDNHFDNFEEYLETTGIAAKGVPPYLLVRSNCEECDEDVLAIRYHGRRILLVHVVERLILHQCPVPGFDTENYPDDPNVRDGDGEIRNGGWHDEYPDDPYNYPDIPYVDPTRGVK